MSDIDLHTHSTASDGSLSPSELVALARASHLRALALTDHDTVAGIPEALEAGKREGVEVIPGCELSVTSDHGAMHILGLWVDGNGSGLASTLAELQHYRVNRNHIIIEKLNAIGVAVSYNDVLAVAGDGSVGRPHFAQVLLDKGYATSMQEAFDRYLGAGGRAYEPKRKLSPAEGIALLKAAGATVVLAHPYLLGLNKAELFPVVRALKDAGLDGIEAHYTEHPPSKTKSYLDIAARLDLLVTGGSDFHGAPKPNIQLGRGKGKLRLPYSLLQALKDHRQAHGLPT
ncbi:MAG: PHP domain-containing protein [Desulfovibrionaceae bacterium]|jgi:predicted metal-dependent phosphoesterase TrpH|nr:PHP domain-containing protein [Desulfovibrionaceae bacterium]